LRPKRSWITVAVLVACSCFGCGHATAYSGTASLQVSGVAGDQLAFRTVTLTSCIGSMSRRSQGDATIADDPVDRFTILALGDGCLF
jgi:hypothetical protein